MRQGTVLFLTAADGADLDKPSLLPGWTRRHVVAHVAANADAIGNLVHWAATGEETPMYASPEDRAAGIERGAALPDREISGWLVGSAQSLEDAMAALPQARWATEIRTAQGRIVPATETAWMRAREVLIHAVDLDTGVGFADLPEGFLTALVEEIRAKRGLDDQLPDGPLPEVAAWLAGRPHRLSGAADLGPWL